jgi:hypothetical protein
MDFTKIIVVSGKSGAFKVLAQSRSGFIVESLIDGKKLPVSASNRITSIEDIVVFTETEEVKLREVFKRMKEKTGGEAAIDHKSTDNDIKAFFESVLPEYDKERVYLSDMKKMIFWFNLLHQNNLTDFEQEEETEEKVEEEVTEKATEAKKEDKPKKEASSEKKPTVKKTPKKEE